MFLKDKLSYNTGTQRFFTEMEANMKLAKEIMTEDVYTVEPDKGFNQVELATEFKHIRHIPVVSEEGNVLGIVSLRDLLLHLSDAAASHFTPIKEIMNTDVITCSPDTPIEEVAMLMKKHTIGCVPVVENKKLVGIVSEADFLKLY